MPTSSEHKTVQARILTYAEAIGWTFVPREQAEHRRGFDPDTPTKDRAKGRSLFFDALLDAKVREFDPRYTEAKDTLPGQFYILSQVLVFLKDYIIFDEPAHCTEG